MSDHFHEAVLKWTKVQRELLRKEENIVDSEVANKRGVSCEITDIESSVGGKYIVTVQAISKPSLLQHYSPSDPISIESDSEGNVGSKSDSIHGIVLNITHPFLKFSVHEQYWKMTWQQIKITPSPNRIVFKRILDTLDRIDTKMKEGSHKMLSLPLLQHYLSEPCERQNFEIEMPPDHSDFFFSSRLNLSQKEAVLRALHAKNIYLIHGPPGTGKTTTLCELIRQLIFRQEKKKILVCAPSNVAVDTILDKLMNSETESRKGIFPLRIGDISRVLGSVNGFSIDEILRTSEEKAIIGDVRKEIDVLLKEGVRKRGKFGELRLLKDELRSREKNAIEAVKGRSNVFFSTINSADNFVIRNETFDVVIMDEAGQCLPAECWIPMLRSSKVIMIGDPSQLPPTVLSNDPRMAKTVFEDLITRYGKSPSYCTLLNTQYRMHEDICNWSSKEFYKGKLLSHSSVAQRNLDELLNPKGQSDYELTSPIVFIDTCQEGFVESHGDGMDASWINHGEANAVVLYVEKLLASGITGESIGIITPYAAQAVLLRKLLREGDSCLDPERKIEVSTVDGFQGREKLVIIITFVRCNKEREVGFLSDTRRINVAITRAQRHLVVIGDSLTLRGNSFLGNLCDYLDATAAAGVVGE